MKNASTKALIRAKNLSFKVPYVKIGAFLRPLKMVLEKKIEKSIHYLRYSVYKIVSLYYDTIIV